MEKKSISERINIWVQTLAIIAAGIWAFYNFIYKENIKPKLLPSHISVKLDLSNAGIRNSTVAIKADFQIKNNSDRMVILLPSVYAIWGATENSELKSNGSQDKIKAKLKSLENVIIDTRDQISSFSSIVVKKAFIETGPIFQDWQIESGESVAKSLIIFFQKNKYDYVEMSGYFAIVNSETAIKDAEWNIYKDGESCSVIFFTSKNSSKAERTMIDPENKSDKEYLNEMDYGIITTNAILSLRD